MIVGEWIALAVLLSLLASGYATILVKLATLATRLKSIEMNHLPTLTKRLENLPCQEHLEGIVAVTVRLEAACARLEKAEKRLNGG